MSKRHLARFEELNVSDLYDILKLRSDVFVVEQACIYPDLDDKDQLSFHLYYKSKNDNGGYSIDAYARLLPPNTSFETASIGRVVVSSQARQKQLGRKLMEDAIQSCRQIWPDEKITIGAQVYLFDFYTSLGFRRISEDYLEDGIPHLDMQLTD